ncbi:hypothetical protein C8R47DRAFT_1081424 [Mycena vitilis]|nr:hypothetical protein C8R47DRAFT_1081424 [Mycena vitilis]
MIEANHIFEVFDSGCVAMLGHHRRSDQMGILFGRYQEYSATSLEPSPTQTDAAAAAEYSKYLDDCTTKKAEAVQSGLAAYSNSHPFDPPITDINDPTYLLFLSTDYNPYIQADAACTSDTLSLQALADSSPTTTSALGSSSVGGGSSESGVASSSPKPGGTTSAGAPPTVSTKGSNSNAAHQQHAPAPVIWLATMVLLGGWIAL